MIFVFCIFALVYSVVLGKFIYKNVDGLKVALIEVQKYSLPQANFKMFREGYWTVIKLLAWIVGSFLLSAITIDLLF